MPISDAKDATALACPHIRDQNGCISLIGNRCRSCGELFFPAARGCTRCCSREFDEQDFGDRGHLWSWTIQGFLPKAPYNSGETEADFKPYGVGYVEMPSGIRIEARLSSADPNRLRIGMPMQLVLEPYRRLAQGGAVHTFAFAPAQESRA